MTIPLTCHYVRAKYTAIERMYFQSIIIVRSIAMLGILLTSMASLQQGHVLCAVFGCQCETVPTDNSSVNLGPHCRGCSTSACTTQQQAPRHSKSINGGHPCSQECWCCQTPAPRVAPRIVMADSQSCFTQLFAVSPSTTPTNGSSDYDGIHLAALSYSVISTAGDACARLCRFVI